MSCARPSASLDIAACVILTGCNESPVSNSPFPSVSRPAATVYAGTTADWTAAAAPWPCRWRASTASRRGKESTWA